MKSTKRRVAETPSIQASLRRSFFRVNLLSILVLFMLLSLPPLVGRLLQPSLSDHLKVVSRDAQHMVDLLKNLPPDRQMQFLEGLNTGQLHILKMDSPQNAGQIYMGALQVDLFTRNDQVTLIRKGQVQWSQGLKPGPVPESWRPHLQAQQPVAFRESNTETLKAMLGDLPAWVARNMTAATWITPLEPEQFLAVTAFQPRAELLTAVLVVLYVVVLLVWGFLALLPATLGSMVVSAVFSHREARTLSQPIEALSRAAREMAAGNLQTRLEPQGPLELQRLGNDINTISENLSRSMQQLQDTLDHQKAFLQAISHDLRTPLSHILAFSEDLSERLSGTPAERKARIIHREAVALNRMVEDLFDLLRFEHPEFRLHLQRVVLNEVVTGVMQGFEGQAHDRQVQLSFHAQCDVQVHADAGRLQQVLVNLISNALRHTPAGGAITLELRLKHKKAELQVRDNGSGIPAEHLPHIFERFYRVDSSRSERHAGLGLTLSRELVQRMHGSLTVQSTEGEGSTFTLVLPAEQ